MTWSNTTMTLPGFFCFFLNIPLWKILKRKKQEQKKNQYSNSATSNLRLNITVTITIHIMLSLPKHSIKQVNKFY